MTDDRKPKKVVDMSTVDRNKVIGILEKMLEEAKRNEYRFAIGFLVAPDGDIEYFRSGFDNAFELMGAFDRAKLNLWRDAYEMDEEPKL